MDGKKIIFFLMLLLPVLVSTTTNAQTTSIDQTIPVLLAKQSHGVTSYSLSIKILAVMTLLTVLPALLITMTAFTRIIVVLAIVRQAIGIPNVPGNQIMIGLALIMTIFVMMPIADKINTNGIQPYLEGKIDEAKAFKISGDILEGFMLKQTRKMDIKLFADMAKARFEQDKAPSFFVLLPAFITSELKTAFEIGFLILLPFLLIDIVVASILMSMGMMMLSPMVISLPFKILFFVMVSGWSLVVTSLITSFRI